ncbi:glycosyltransferase [Sphingomonas humi]|uniref:Glycosyltransferase n=1 Tax=Sphingomonas humi TaxID=335630 RepID=A0ABP7SDJ1_9SPHN
MAQLRRRIAFFLPDMAGGGAERVQLAIIRHLVTAGHEVDLILAFDGGVLLPLVPPEVRVIPLRARRLAGAMPGLIRYLRIEKPWSLQAIMWPCTVIAVAARLAARSRARLVLSDHTFLTSHYTGRRTQRVLRASMRLLYRLADHRVAVSSGAANDVARLAGLPPEAVEVIYNPIEVPDHIAPTAAATMAWGDASPRIITVGSLKPEKNHSLLLRAFARLVEHHPAARLLILGEGQLRADLERQRDALGLHEQVLLAGFKIDPWPYYAGADLFVLSSDYEGMSLVLVEALYAGLPVVSTDCEAGPAEILDDGLYGPLVPVGDAAALSAAMMKTLAQPKNPERQKARARQITGEQNLRRYEALLAG